MNRSRISAPGYARRAWAKFLRRQGATYREIADALGIGLIEAARLSRSNPRPKPAGEQGRKVGT